MKITPLAVWSAQLENAQNLKQLKEVCTADSKWIHSNPMVHDAVFLYCVAIAHLLNNPTKEMRARDAFNQVYKLSKTDFANTYEVKKVDDHNTTEYVDGCQLWLEEAMTLAQQAKGSQVKFDEPYLYDRKTRTKNYDVVDK